LCSIASRNARNAPSFAFCPPVRSYQDHGRTVIGRVSGGCSVAYFSAIDICRRRLSLAACSGVISQFKRRFVMAYDSPVSGIAACHRFDRPPTCSSPVLRHYLCPDAPSWISGVTMAASICAFSIFLLAAGQLVGTAGVLHHPVGECSAVLAGVVTLAAS
jgi:hypothetical protein